MSVFRKGPDGKIVKVGGMLEQRFNPKWFECTREMRGNVEVYVVPEVAKDWFSLGAERVYYFGFFEPNTTNNPKLDFLGTLLDIQDITQPTMLPAPGTLVGIYQMFTDATENEALPTAISYMPTVFAGNMIASVSAKGLPAGSEPTVENKGTEYRANFEFGIPAGTQGPAGKDGKDGTSLDIQQEIYESPSDLPAFADTTVNQAFVVKNTTDGYDMYFHAIDGTDWTIIPNWGGVQGPEGPAGKDGPEGPQGKLALQCLSAYTNGEPALEAEMLISSTLFNREADVGDNCLVLWESAHKSWIVTAEVIAVASNVTLKVINFIETTGLPGPIGPKGADGATGAPGRDGAPGPRGYSIKLVNTPYETMQSLVDDWGKPGYSSTWEVESVEGIEVGDAVALRVRNTTKNGDAFVLATVTDIPNGKLTCTSAGLLDKGSRGLPGADGDPGPEGPRGPKGNPILFNFGTGPQPPRYRIFAKLPKNDPSGNHVVTVQIAEVANYGERVTGVYLIQVSSRGGEPTIAENRLIAPASDLPQYKVWYDAESYYFGFLTSPWVGEMVVSLLSASAGEVANFYDSETPPPYSETTDFDRVQYTGPAGHQFMYANATYSSATTSIDAYYLSPSSASYKPKKADLVIDNAGNVFQVESVVSTGGTNNEGVLTVDYRFSLKGSEGLGIFRSSQSTSTGSTSINISTISVPSGRSLKVGDLIIANSTYAYLYRVTAVGSSTVTVTYLQSLRGATGATGPAGAAGSNAPNFNLLTDYSGRWSASYEGAGISVSIAATYGEGCQVHVNKSGSSYVFPIVVANCSKTFTVTGTKTIAYAYSVSTIDLPLMKTTFEIINSSGTIVYTNDNSNVVGSRINGETRTVQLSSGTYHVRIKAQITAGGTLSNKVVWFTSPCVVLA